MLNGILWILRTGAPWADLPSRYPSYQTCHRRLQQWVRSGVLKDVLEVLVGHSAGGHLAMWAAVRSRVPRGSALFMSSPLPVRGVVDLAGPLDLTTNIEGYEGLCGDRVITNLMGGTPAAMPEHYAHASPMKLLPLGVPQVVVLGEYEEFVPLQFAEAYVQRPNARVIECE